MSPPERTPPAFPLRYLYFFLSGGCNLRCRHCWIAPQYQELPGPRGSVDFALFEHIVREAKAMGVEGVKLTGGEPLLHPRIKDILELLLAENLGLMLETNAMLMTPELARVLARFPGLLVSVSLDSPEAEVHEWVRGREGCFAATLAGMGHLVAAGVPFQIIMTLMRRNRDQMEALIPLARKLGAGLVKFNIIQPLSRGEQMYERDEALSIPELVELGRWVETDLAKRSELPLYFHHPLAFQPLSKIISQGGLDCNSCGILGIMGVLDNGAWAMCGLSEDLPELVFGQAGRDRLAEVWEETPLLRELRAGLPRRLEGICGQCLLQDICQGSCIAQNYTMTGSLWAPFWYCRLADEAGLFPVSRKRPERPGTTQGQVRQNH
jgi:SynChlorMet cassette radical SAM/SPASM protein ScmF